MILVIFGILIGLAFFAILSGAVVATYAWQNRARGQRRRATWQAVAAGLLILIPAYFLLWLGTMFHLALIQFDISHTLHGVWMKAVEYHREHPDQPDLPAGWMGSPENEPTYTGSGKEIPYNYLPVPDFNPNRENSRNLWIAYSPEPLPQYWWMIWNPLPSHNRSAVWENGFVAGMSEAQFQAELARQRTLREAK